jgi:hypothetical protein
MNSFNSSRKTPRPSDSPKSIKTVESGMCSHSTTSSPVHKDPRLRFQACVPNCALCFINCIVRMSDGTQDVTILQNDGRAWT